MKTQTRTPSRAATPFDQLPKDYLGLCQSYVPRPLHDAADYAAACQAIEPIAGFADRLTDDQTDYLAAVSTFIEAYDQTKVKWPKGHPARHLEFPVGATRSDRRRSVAPAGG